jgi:DNA repair exonuclease SbcCD ATPase subunit
MDIKRGDDLFQKIGNKDNSTQAEGAAKAEPSQSDASAGNEVNQAVNAKSDDLLAKTAGTGQAGAEVESSDSKAVSGKEEPSGSKTPIQEPESWDEDSKFKEIKKLREENKISRIKYQEKLEALKKEADERLEAERQKIKEYEDAKKELDRLKAQEEDKKRDLNEKLTHREKKIAELESYLEARENDFNKQLEDYKTKLQELEADKEVRLEGYRNRVQEELDAVPEKFKDYANLIVKGAEDPQDALIALQEAKMKGLFEDKKVIVNHSVPGASDGARATKEQLDGAAKAARDKMTSQQKIKAGLDAIRGGTPNSAFKTR